MQTFKSGTMQIVRKKISVVAGLLMLFSMVACKKWVDGAPQPLQVDESKVFSTENGFREALNGVYLQMGSSTLYGKDLTMGVLSLAGRNFDSVSVNKAGQLYYQAATYNFTDQTVKNYSADVWAKMYQSVANLNNLLGNIELKKDMFTGNNYNTFKGEALALRAYLHFDLLRLFAPVDAGAPGIPYVTTISVDQTPTATVTNTLDKCIADLAAADALLSPNDLINTAQITKWAVKGLLARVYLYKGDVAKANENALAVINSNKFALSVNTNADLFFTKESLFKLNIYSNNYAAYYKAIFGTSSLVGLSASGQIALYGSTNVDYRKSFIDAVTGTATGTPLIPKKLTVTASNIFPMIRLTEMYYILAECASDVPTGLSYLNQVRAARNLAALTAINVPDATTLSAEIMNEYRKEFIGEGQLFFYYKRKNTAFTALPFYPKVPAVAGVAYVPMAANPTYTFVKPE
jgi:hypothetical protein